MISTNPKTIGIDGRFYGEAGPGRYTKNIVTHLEKIDSQNKYIIFLRPRGFKSYTPKNSNFQKVEADYKWYSFAEQFLFLAKILKYKLDLFYVPHFNVPVLYPGKLVTAIPDLIMHTFSTEKGTTLPKFYFKIKKFVYRLVFWIAIKRSSIVIVPAKVVLDEFRKYYPNIPVSKYIIAGEGIDPDTKTSGAIDNNAVLAKYKITIPFILYVGSMYEHKNMPRLLNAFKLLKEKYGYLGKLVIVGKKDKFSYRVVRDVTEKSLNESVLVLGQDGFVEDCDILALRKECDIYVFPSLKEGFSLTPMEAQQFGKACAVSDIPIHKEVYGDSVLYFNPESVEDIAEKMNKLLIDPNLQNLLIEKGYGNLRNYSWDNTAQITLDVFHNILKS